MDELLSLAARLTARMPKDSEAAKLSLVECGLRDVAGELRQWGGRVSGQALTGAMGSSSLVKLSDFKEAWHLPLRAAAGLVLLAHAAVRAWDAASEEQVWPAVAEGFSASVAEVLFHRDSAHPRRSYKDAVESAVRLLPLRHVLDEVDRHQWVGTMLLQIGFTRQGAVAGLGRWLAQATSRPLAVASLLDPEKGSGRFRTAVTGLELLRSGQFNRTKARVAAGEWLLEEADDAILDSACASVNGSTTGVELGSPATTAASVPPTFLEKPRLRWDGRGLPAWEAEVLPPGVLSLDPRRAYEITVVGDGSEPVRIGPQGRVGGPVRLAGAVPTAEAVLMDADGGGDPRWQELELWDDERAVDWQAADKGCAAVLGEEVEVAHPAGDPWPVATLPGGRRVLYHAAGSGPVEFLTDGLPLADGDAGQLPDAVQAVSATLDGDDHAAHPLGGGVTINVVAAASVTVTRAVVGGRAYRPENAAAGGCRVVVVEVLPRHLNGVIRLRLALRHEGLSYSRSFDLEARVAGAAVESPAGGWIPLDRACPLDAASLGNRRMRVRVHERWSDHRPGQGVRYEPANLFEGDAWRGRADGLMRRPGLGEETRGLAGLGGSLTTGGGTTLCDTVVDHGLLASVSVPQADSGLPLVADLAREVEVGPGYELIVWLGDGTVVRAPPQSRGRRLTAPFPGADAWRAVGLAYNGGRVGACWSPGWSNPLPGAAVGAARVAGLLRWFKLPVLQCPDAVWQLVRDDPPAAAAAFYIAAEVPGETGLVAPGRTAAWYAAARRVLRPWLPQDGELRSLVGRLAGCEYDAADLHAFGTALDGLFDWDPVLAARAGRVMIADVHRTARGGRGLADVFRDRVGQTRRDGLDRLWKNAQKVVGTYDSHLRTLAENAGAAVAAGEEVDPQVYRWMTVPSYWPPLKDVLLRGLADAADEKMRHQ